MDYIYSLSKDIIFPKHIIYLNVNINTALERCNDRKEKKKEIFENEELLRNIKTNYETLFLKIDLCRNSDPKDIVNIYKIDANRSEEEVFTDVLKTLTEIIGTIQ